MGTKSMGRMAVLVSLLLSMQALAVIQTAGKVASVKKFTDPKSGNQGVVFTLSPKGAVEVVPFAPDVVRVRFHWDSLWDKENVAIAKPFGDWPVFSATFTDGSVYKIETAELTVEIVKSPNFQIHFKDKSGFYLSKDTRMEFDPDYQPLADSTYANLRWTGAWPQGFKLKAVRESPANEAYFGFGEVPAPLNRRGKTIQGWNADTFSWGENQNPMYITFPFFYGVQGREADHPPFAYGLFFNNPARPFFRMNNEWADKYSFQASDGQLDYFFFGGGAAHSMKGVLSRYTELTGRPTMLPKWAFGFQIARWSYNNQSWVEWLCNEFRVRDFPLDAFFLDIDYMDINADDYYYDETLHQLTINSKFPNPKGMIDFCKGKGIKSVAILEPWITTGDPKWQEASQNQHFLKNPDGSTHVSSIFFGDVSWIDFSSTPARDWWRGKVKGFLNAYPFAGLWNDLNEPADNDNIPLNGLYWLDGRYSGFNPGDSRYWHLNEKNQLCVRETQLTYQIYKEQYPNTRPFILSRSGFPGIQRYALGWSGDNTSNYDALRYNIPLGTSVMISGQVNFGHDVGGFVGDSDGELLTRWTEWASMNPFFRNHSMKSFREREPWRFGDDYGAKMRDIIKFRYRLMPYLYTLAYQSTQTGIPMNMPTVFDFMEDTESHYQNDNDFMVGDYLLIAPIFAQSADNRWVYLPKGADWTYWHSDQKFTGGQWVNVSAPLGTLPIFVRAGAIIPMGPPMKYVNEFVPDFLDLNVWPGGESEFTLYEDDGETFDYVTGEFAKTRIVSKLATDGTIELTINPREGTFNPGARSLFVIAHDVLCPMTVTQNGAAVSEDASFATTPSFHFDPAERTLTIKVKDTGAQSTLVAKKAGSCSVAEFKISAVQPEFGIDDGAEPITLTGSGFTGVSKVQLGGIDCKTLKVSSDTKITCKTPAHAAGWVTVTATKTDGMLATKDYGYRYTGDQTVNIGWCDLQWPPELTVKSGSATANLYGQVWSKKITEPAGAPSGITAQVGYGPQGTDPRSRYGWKWFDATWNVQAGNNDEFVGTVTPTTAGTYSYAYRFSDDSGVNYMVCDYNPGTSDGFATDKLGKLVVATKSSKTDDPGDPTICGGGDEGGCSSAGGATPTFLGLLLFLATVAWLTTRREP